MKALREFFIVVLCIALVCLTTSLAILVGLKDVLQGSLITEEIKEIVKLPEGTENSEEINKAIDEIASYKGTSDIIDSVLDDVSNSEDGNLVLSDKTYDLIIKAIEDNREDLLKMGVTEKDLNEVIDQIKNPENREKVNEDMTNSFKEFNIDVGGSNVNAVSKISSVIAPKTIKKLMITIVVIICLIALLSFSPYKWIRPVSISSLISGLNVLIVYAGFDMISQAMLESSSNIKLDSSKLLSIGLPLVIGGICGLVIYTIINTIVKSSKNKVDNKPTKGVEIPIEDVSTNELKEEPVKPEKFCAGCGAPVGKEDKVCSSCGAPLD